MNPDEIEVQPAELPTALKGKALLDALFLKAAIGHMYIFNRKPGKHHQARAQRAHARITKRKAKR